MHLNSIIYFNIYKMYSEKKPVTLGNAKTIFFKVQFTIRLKKLVLRII